jgi:hypothetical protein
VQHWYDELFSNSDPHLAMIKITKATELKTCTYIDIIKAGNRFITLFSHNIKLGQIVDAVIVNHTVLKNQDCPLLQQFYWHRVVNDEGEFYVSDNQGVRGHTHTGDIPFIVVQMPYNV